MGAMHHTRAKGLASSLLPLAAVFSAASNVALDGEGPLDAKQLQEQFIEGRDFDHICDGFDEEWDNCEGLPQCGPCTPSDCIWSPWAEWHYAGGCIGLNLRERRIRVRANECGKPCDGIKEESMIFVPEHCKPHGADCRLSAWSAWSACAGRLDQSSRERQVEQSPQLGGMPCVGSLKETQPCGPPKETDCELGPWQEWTSCSVTCGDGRYTRMRRIVHEASNGGSPCWDMLLHTATCSMEPCPGRDCKQSAWTPWGACSEGRTQQFRSRSILEPPKEAGMACEPDLMQTRGCPRANAVDCKVNAWSEWSLCDKECGGGQRFRERQLEAPARHGGTCQSISLKEAEKCGVPCPTATPQDCILNQWNYWSDCSAVCGEGSKTRTRTIASDATFGGAGCEGGLTELEKCSAAPCSSADCQWSGWTEWSPCSSSCGGGMKKRTRAIAVSPSSGGRPCDASDKELVAPCNTQPCGVGCVDGRWGEWQAWTDCSGTCSTSYKSRRRDLDAQPNYCGSAALGTSEEFALCTALPSCLQDQDCQVSEWEEWSRCSVDCFGTRERNRRIVEFASGNGKACDHGLKQIEPCNPGKDERTPKSCSELSREDCQMDQWESWSVCSVSCGGGQKARRRTMLVAAQNGGRACHNDLVVTEPCGTQPCADEGCLDCVWNLWSEWSACSKCGGHKYRQRSIERMPNRCGQRCDMRTAKEVTQCPNKCENMHFCAWTEWSSPHCTNHCGNATAPRSRTLVVAKDPKEYFFVGANTATCTGQQLNQSLCPYTGPCKICNPVNCDFAPWSEWSKPSCQGLCERSRFIAHMNNECGEPCAGAMLGTKQCPTEPCDAPKDCVLSAWESWTPCLSRGGTGNSQRYRARTIKQKPLNGGQPCHGGVLNMTMGCGPKGPRPCLLTPWAEWSPCSLSCGIGWHVRKREVLRPAHRSGRPCKGNLKELAHCKAEDQSGCQTSGQVDCVLGEWGAWSRCAGGQRFRNRKILQPSLRRGQPCEGLLHETEACELEKIDCKVSTWTEWDQCDHACGEGQVHRQRQIHHFPENDGMPCPHELMQTKGCKLRPCIVRNCTVTAWSEWGPCKEPCGPGMQVRSRGIEHLRDPGGLGCTNMLAEARDCPNQPVCDKADCTWNDWEAWRPCSTSCGGGWRARHRQIRTWPLRGGKSCDAADLGEVEPCNTQPCGEARCEDGAWFDWGAWSPCSASCDGGVTFRTRTIARMANECGCPPAGKDRETAFCNVDTPCGGSVDCAMSMWEEWEACSATCDGVKRRKRHVETYGSGHGKWCKGALRQTWPCNPASGEDPPKGCEEGPRKDCELSEWREWSLCSATCGGGEHIRTRTIKQYPTYRGKPCDDSLSEIKECARSECGGPASTDCKFGEWEQWAHCDRCSGERTRFRSILSFPVNGGKECEPSATKEVGSCPRRCHHPKFCEWDEWSRWTACTATCGIGGKRRRNRHLHLTEVAQSKMAALQGYEVLRDQAKMLEVHHPQEAYAAFAAFAAGCIAVLAALGAIALRNRAGGAYRPLRDFVGLEPLPTAEDIELE